MKKQPVLTFSQNKNLIYLEDRETGRILFVHPAHNVTENMPGEPLKTGSGSPAPLGWLCLSLPDFISEEFRDYFYRRYLDGEAHLPGECLVRGWGEFEEEQMGRVRFALGCPYAPSGTGDHAAWERELLIHGGGWFEKPTRGCIRMSDGQLEHFAANVIKARRMGMGLTTVLKVED